MLAAACGVATHYYVSIQHNSSGFGTILDITGRGSQGQGN